MVDYLLFKFTGCIAELTVAQAQQVLQQFDAVDAENQRRYDEVLRQHGQLVTQAEQLYGRGHRVVKYLRANKPDAPKTNKAARRKFVRDWAAELQRRERRAYQRDRRERMAQATEALESAGFKLGTHFNRGRAITYAKAHLVEVEPGVYAPMLPSKASE